MNVRAPSLLSALSGVSFALLGLSYILADRRGLRPVEVVFICSVTGVLVFSARHRLWRRRMPLAPTVPRIVWVCAGLAGVTQFLALVMVGSAVRLGPLSPLWCAVSLGFIPVIAFSAIHFREPLDRLKIAAVLAGIACVLVASLGSRGDGGALKTLGQAVLYAIILLAILVTNSVISVVIKVLGMRKSHCGTTLAITYQAAFLSGVYGVITIASGTTLVCLRGWEIPWSSLLPIGLLAAVGSMLGLGFLTAAAHGSAAVVFTMNGISSILAASLISVCFLHEPASAAWFGTIALGIVSVSLGGLSEARGAPAPSTADLSHRL